jgi:hypothetical protein
MGTMSKYPAPTIFAPTLREYESVAEVVARDFTDGVAEQIVRRNLVESGWRERPQEIPQVDTLIGWAKQVVAENRDWKDATAREIVIKAVSTRLGVKDFSIGSETEHDMLAFEKFRVLQLPWRDLLVAQTDVGTLLEQVKKADKGPREQEHKECLGASYALSQSTKRIYFTYPEAKFPEVAQLFFKYGVRLTVRPKELPGEGTKAALGLSPDQGGIVALLTVEVPDDEWVARHIARLLPDQGIIAGAKLKLNNTKVAMSLLLLHDHKQDVPYGPQWGSERQKIETYERFSLGHLLD